MIKINCIVAVLNLYIFWCCLKLTVFFLHLISLSSQLEHWMKKQPLILWIPYITLPTAALSNTKMQRDPADFGRDWSAEAAGVWSQYLVGPAEQTPSSPSQFPDRAWWGEEEIWLSVKGGPGVTVKAVLLFHIVLSGRGSEWAPKLVVWRKWGWWLNTKSQSWRSHFTTPMTEHHWGSQGRDEDAKTGGFLPFGGLPAELPCCYLHCAWDSQRDRAGQLSAKPSPQTLLSHKMSEISFIHGTFHSACVQGKNINAFPWTDRSSLTNLQFRNCSQLAGAPLPGQLHEKLIKFNGCHFSFEPTFYLKLQEEAINCSVYHGFKKKWKLHRKMWSTVICKTNISLHFT